MLASYDFLQQGIVKLNLALDEAKNEQISKVKPSADQDSGSKATEITTRNESESRFFNEAIELSNAIQKLNNTSNCFASTEKYFRKAREKATEAFCNEAMSLPERIMATKLRVVSKILECLQDTKEVTAGCMLFLEKLHTLPAIGETFATYFKGGIKSRAYKDSRLENVKSVLSLNFAISELVARFSGELPNVTNWPRIHLPTRGKTIHPLVIDPWAVKKLFGDKEFQPPENHLISDQSVYSLHVSFNSKRDLLQVDKDCINIVNRSGDMKRFCELRQATTNPKGDHQHVAAFTIDRHDNVFLIIYFEDRTSKKYVFVLFVFDSKGNERHEFALDSQLEYALFMKINLCVVNNDIFIHKERDDFIYICDGNGNLKSRLSLEQDSSYHSGDFNRLECITNDDDIVMRSTDQSVLVYTKDGKLKHTMKVKNDIEAVTYNYVTSKIEILIKKEKFLGTKSYYIRSYSEGDEVSECLYLPVKSSSWGLSFCQHAAGATALVMKNDLNRGSIIFM